MRETATDLEALQALLTDSIERASPFLRSSFQMPRRSLSASQLTAHRARHFARRPGASLTYFEGTDLAVVAHGHATIIDERDPTSPSSTRSRSSAAVRALATGKGHGVYLRFVADSLFTYASDSAR